MVAAICLILHCFAVSPIFHGRMIALQAGKVLRQIEAIRGKSVLLERANFYDSCTVYLPRQGFAGRDMTAVIGQIEANRGKGSYFYYGFTTLRKSEKLYDFYT